MANDNANSVLDMMPPGAKKYVEECEKLIHYPEHWKEPEDSELSENLER